MGPAYSAKKLLRPGYATLCAFDGEDERHELRRLRPARLARIPRRRAVCVLKEGDIVELDVAPRAKLHMRVK